MQIVIEIDEKRYKDILRISTVQLKKRTPTLEQVIANGVPLQKGHDALDFLTDRPCDYCVNHQHGYCTVWSCPFDGAAVYEKQNEGHYEYGIFDGEGKLVGNIWDDGEFAKSLCEERNARSVKKVYCVKKRLVMAWEAVEEEGDLQKTEWECEA